MPDSKKIIVDSSLAKELIAVRDQLLGGEVSAILLRDSRGTDRVLNQPVADFFRTVVTIGAQSRLTIHPLPEIITTTVAAYLLGTTRPTLRKWIDAGILPAHHVGSHTKLRTADVQAFQEKRLAERQDAFDKLRAFEEEFFPGSN